MNKRKKPRTVETNTAGKSRRKSLALLMFEEYAATILREFVENLPLAFTREDLLQEIHTCLDHSIKEIRLRGKIRMRVKAIDLPKYFNPPHTGEKFEILEQADFKQAEPLYTDKNLTMLDEPMQRLRRKAGELSIGWDAAVSVVKKVSQKIGPDVRPASVQRGEFGELIIQDLIRIRDGGRKFRSFEELERTYEKLEVVRMIKTKYFDQGDRDLLTRPNQWGRVMTYAAGLLVKYFEKSLHTIRQDRKRFNAWKKLQKPEKF
jgi:hypothetical protein